MALSFNGRARPALLAGALLLSTLAAFADDVKVILDDPYMWLEDVNGERAMQWVGGENSICTNQLDTLPGFKDMQEKLLTIMNSRERIPGVAKHGKYYYNFWRDDKNPRGLWRRTTLDEYKKVSPAWEVLLDVDALAAMEKENWVWHGYEVLQPSYDRCLIQLSHGGADAAVVREFDLNTKTFVTDGFYLPEAKSDVSWRNHDSIYLGTDFGPGSMTSSGYPRIIKEWHRGTPISSATVVFEAKPDDVAAGAYVSHDHGQVYEWVVRTPTTFTDEMYLRKGDQWVKLEKPADASVSTYGKLAMFRLRSAWTVNGETFPAGSLIAADLQDYMNGGRNFTVIFKPSERVSLASISDTKNYLILTELDNVHSRPYLVQYDNGKWVRSPIPAPDFGAVEVSGIDSDDSDDYFVNETDFLTPPTLLIGTAGVSALEKIKAMPSLFNASGLEIQQFQAKSKDGTMVPYFVVNRKGMRLDGQNITLLSGYGGFEIARLPAYSAAMGAAWLDRGGVYVLANIRGGGEFGPQWHEAARKEHRQRAYDDFIAVAEDLITRGITSPKRLGIEGRSNGGLLMGVMITERPDLFGAVHCGSPLLDMRRYNKLLAGASWMDEYGDPDRPEDWAYIQKYSPYQNCRADKIYPPILITTSTRDDRVHPGHARKFAARLKEQGHEMLYYENIEGGHGAAANNRQSAFMETLAYAFLWDRLSH